MASNTRSYLNRIVGGVAACLLLAAAGASFQPDPLSPPANGPRKADPTWQTLLNATVHVKPGQVLEHATVVLRNGKIVSVKGTPVPGGEVALTAAAVKEAKAEEERAKQPKATDTPEKKAGDAPEKKAPEPMAPAGPEGARTWDCKGLHI
ncbi:MAG: hypothetical protein H7210_01735, partial [Pyrinomonadaceae bacterium]|nr:hypothetical protein [Phycisphaerales bacterium]